MDPDIRQAAFAVPPPVTPGSEEAEQKFLRDHEYVVPSRMPRFYDSPVPLLTAWDPPSVRAALEQHVIGTFGQSALLFDEMLAYEAMDTARSTRLQGVISHPMEIVPSATASSPRQAKRARDMLAERIEDLLPEYVLDRFLTYGEGLGFQAAQLLWSMSEKRWWPQIQHWHGALTYYLVSSRTFMAITMEGQAPIVAGDGHWILHAPHGLYRGWLHSKVRACSYPWLAAQYALRDWMRYCEVHGLPIKKLKVPSYANERQKQDFERLMSTLGSEPVVALPQNVDPKGVSWDLELLEATSNSWQGFEAIIARCDKRISISWLGQNLTTDVDAGSLAAANVHSHVKLEMSKSDARLLATTLNEQLIKKWAEYNFDDVSLAPRISWLIEDPEDLQAKSTAINTAAQAFASLTQSGIKVDPVAFFMPYGVQVTGQSQPQPGPAAPSQPQPGPAMTVLSESHPGRGVASGDAYIDDATSDAVEELAHIMKRPIDRILDEIDSADSYEAVIQSLPSIDDLTDPRQIELFEHGLITGHLAGRLAVDTDHPTEDIT